ncbi:MAG: FtsX-like permease family protein [Gemmatimonadota bacterium]|nr:FtsX-like permease family protein [Gemmatimonadota bacterium]
MTKYPDSTATRSFFDPLFERIRAIPGVRAAGMVNVLPIQNWGWNGNFSVETRPTERLADQPFSEFRRVSTGYFDALKIPVRRGRDFSERDAIGTAPVVIINEALAKRYFPKEDPIGRRIGDPPNDWSTIIGVVGDVRQAGLDREPLPEQYLLSAQMTKASTLSDMTLTIATTVEPTSITGAVRDAVRAVDPSQPIFRIRTMDQVIGESLTSRALYLLLLGVFAGIALALACAGIYGVMSYLVTQRTREIGIRMALGAQMRDVLRLVVRQGMMLAVAGIIIGVIAAIALTRLIQGLLYGVSATDALTFSAVAVSLAVVALVASWIPARRATRVDPVIAIRAE